MPQVGKVKINYPVFSKRRNWNSTLVINISKGPQLVQKKQDSQTNQSSSKACPSPANCQIPCRHNKKLIDRNSYFPAYSCGFRGSHLSRGDSDPLVWRGARGCVVQLSGARQQSLISCLGAHVPCVPHVWLSIKHHWDSISDTTPPSQTTRAASQYLTLWHMGCVRQTVLFNREYRAIYSMWLFSFYFPHLWK